MSDMPSLTPLDHQSSVLTSKPSTTNQEYNGAKELTLHTPGERDGRPEESSNEMEKRKEIQLGNNGLK